ncbi:MAG: amidase [Cytophagales bacterium]|nr:amidase [Cytophagales bacterium]
MNTSDLPPHVFLTTYPALFEPLPAGAAFKFSIKDLFDVAGEVTTAGSKVLQSAAPAASDAMAVARLKAAGGVAVGRTTMSEFAFSGVGWNPHFGTPENPFFNMPLSRRPSGARITGGSSSGAASSVACKAGAHLGGYLADIGLGSDTGGSLRIPAALCGLVGFKSTARLVPTTGALPLSPTLDTVGAITRDVATAIKAHEILTARTMLRSGKSLADYRVAIVDNVFLDGVDETVQHAFQRTLQALQNKGLSIEHITLPELADIPAMNKTGGFSPIESYRWHKDLIAAKQADYDPRVAQRILLGKNAAQADYQTLQTARAHWIERISAKLARFDAVLSPTVPIVAPTLASIAHDDAEFFRINALLLRNPSIVNLLDGCAISIPCHSADELPVGLMIWHAALHDDAVLNLGLLLEK